MDIALRPISADELEDYVRAGSLAFGYDFDPAMAESERLVFEPERSVAAFEGDRMVGGAITASLRIAVPGAVIPAAGLTSASVIPTHRRRGVLTAIMQQHFEQVREREESLSILWATEAVIYGRFGYGTGTLAGRFAIERAHARFTQPHRPTGRTRVLDVDGALKAFPPIYERVQPGQPGMIAWTPAWWRYGFTQPENFREGKPVYVLHETDGEADGYLVYRFRPKWVEGVPGGTMEVDRLIAATTEAYADLWRYCFDLDLAARVTGHPFRVDEPVLQLLAEPRRMKLTVGDGLWVRLADVASALSSRRYASDERLRFSVRDTLCPWNQGTFELEGGPDGAECKPSSGEPDLELTAAELGAAYLGGTRFRTLAGAGRVGEVAPGAVGRADRMFLWDPSPWSPEVF